MLNKLWNDPVWSKVIAGIILTSGAALGTYFFNWWPAIGHFLSEAYSFALSSTSVPNWILGVIGLLALSIGFPAYQWLRRKRGGCLAIEHVGPRALSWQLGKRGEVPVMMPWGDFHITNRTAGNVAVPRSILVVSYRRWGILPARRRVDGFGVFQPLPGHAASQERLHWEIEPPILEKGEVLTARVCLIDHLGGENWTPWLRWPSL